MTTKPDEDKPDCADTCPGYDESDGECVDGCRHLVQNYDVSIQLEDR